MKIKNRLQGYKTPDQISSQFPHQKSGIILNPYDPANEKIAAFHQSSSKIKFLCGGNGSAKTESGVYELLTKAIDGHGETIEGKSAWVCTVTNEMIGTTLWPKIQKYLPPSAIKYPISWINQGRKIPGMVTLSNNVRMIFKSYEQGSEAFQAAAPYAILHDEEPKEIIFTESIARLVRTGGYYILTMTPWKGMTWVYDRLYKTNNPDVARWTVSLLENKHTPQADKDWFIRQLGKDEIDKRVYGLFVRLEGSVFKEFNERINVIPRFPIPNQWRHYRAFDLGYNDPFCCLWAALSPDNKIYVYREYLQNARLIAEHAKVLREREQEGLTLPNVPIYYSGSVCDHERQTRAEMEAEGIETTPAQKDVELGIQVVNRLFKAGRLLIFSDLTQTILGVNKYHYEPLKPGKPGKETPAKIDDHTVDTLRYLCMEIESNQGEPSISFDNPRTF